MKKRYLSVTGTMGVGKSTLTKLLADRLSYRAVYEKFNGNVFLPRFFSDRKRWAFHSQTYFLIEKINLLINISKSHKSVVQDTNIYTDIFSYARAQYRQKNMEKAEWELFLRIYKLAEKQLPKPDLIIYLEAPSKIIYDRIMKRNRDFEAKTKKQDFLKYLDLLTICNDEWIKKESRKSNLLKVDTTKLDYLNNPEHEKKLLGMIKKYAKI